jgi:hypothetical protein
VGEGSGQPVHDEEAVMHSDLGVWGATGRARDC